MKIAVVCAPGVGDAVILHIVSHHLTLAGFEVVTHSPHRFGQWLAGYPFGDWNGCDAIFLQHDNTPQSKAIHSLDTPVYTFYGSHILAKHGPLRTGYDYVCDLNRTMVDNVVTSLQTLFHIAATADNGFRPPLGLTHRKYIRRIAIHTTSGHPDKNWPLKKFLKVAKWLEKQGYEPSILPNFPSLEEMTSFIYESGFFLGNDSGPGHIASCLQIPHLIIGKEEKQMRHWRPGWGYGEVLTPPLWIPNWKPFQLRKNNWKSFITKSKVINTFKHKVLSN
jgi:hypothetical protein